MDEGELHFRAMNWKEDREVKKIELVLDVGRGNMRRGAWHCLAISSTDASPGASARSSQQLRIHSTLAGSS